MFQKWLSLFFTFNIAPGHDDAGGRFRCVDRILRCVEEALLDDTSSVSTKASKTELSVGGLRQELNRASSMSAYPEFWQKAAEGLSERDEAESLSLEEVTTMLLGWLPETSLISRCGSGLLVHFHKWHMIWFLVISLSVYAQVVAIRAVVSSVAAIKPIVPEALFPPAAPSGQRWGNDTGSDVVMGALDVDPDPAKKNEPLREKAFAEGSTHKTPRGSVMPPLEEKASERWKAMRAMEMERRRRREVIPPAVPCGQRRGEELGLAGELRALEAEWCPTKKGYRLRGLALAEGPTANPPRGAVGMELEEEAAERRIALKGMELEQKPWNIRGAVMGDAAVGRDAQARLFLVESLVAAVGSLFSCVVFRSPPSGEDGLGLQPNEGAGKSFKDIMRGLSRFLSLRDAGGGAKDEEHRPVDAGFAFLTGHVSRAKRQKEAIVDVSDGGEEEKPGASALYKEQGSLAIARWGDEAEHSSVLLWARLKTQERGCLYISPFGGRLALLRYRSVTHLWVLLSLAIKPGSDDGTREARQRSLLPSPLLKDSQLALLDLFSTGKIRPPPGHSVKAAFGVLVTSGAQAGILVKLRVLVKVLVRDRSVTMGEFSSSPISGDWRSLLPGVMISYQVVILARPSQLEFNPAKPGRPAPVVGADAAGAVLMRGEPRVQLGDQEYRVRPEWKGGDITPQPKGHMSLGQWNPMEAELFKHGLTMWPEKPISEKGKFGKDGSLGVRKQGGYLVVERSVLQFFMECRVVGSGSKVPMWDVTGPPVLPARWNVELPEGSVPGVVSVAIVASVILFVMAREWCKLLTSITSVATGLLGLMRTRVRCGARNAVLTVGPDSARSHRHASRKLALRSPLARAGVLGACNIWCDGASPGTEVGDRLRAFWSNPEHHLRGLASSTKGVKLCFSRACLVWTCLIPGVFGQPSLPFGTSAADGQCSLDGPLDCAAEAHSGRYTLDWASDYFNDMLLLALFLVIVLLAYKAALVFGWHQGCRFILVRRAIRAERFERLLEQKSEECNQKGSEILALQAHIRDLRGHLSNAQPELLRALHDEQAKSRGLARELQLYEDSSFDKNQRLIALERHIRELQEVLRGYESLRRSGHRVMTRAYNELEHHYNRYHRQGEIFVANRGTVWHWDGTCYKLQNATVRELWPCTTCANDVMTPHIPNEHGVSLENSITGWLVSADSFDASAVDRPMFPMEVDVTSGPASSTGAAGSSFLGF
eukprot:s132_g12.t1